MTHSNHTMFTLTFVLAACGSASFGAGASAGGLAGGGGGGGGEAPAIDPAAGGNWSLEERQYWTELQKELDEFSKRTNEHCHSQISASYDKESFRGKLTAGGSYGMDQFARSVCTSGALDAIRDVCTESDGAKQAVAANIHHVVCAWGKTSYGLNKGTFFATYNTNDSDQLSNYLEPMKAYIKKHI